MTNLRHGTLRTHTSLNTCCFITWQRTFSFWVFKKYTWNVQSIVCHCPQVVGKVKNFPLQNKPPFWIVLSISFPGPPPSLLIAFVSPNQYAVIQTLCTDVTKSNVSKQSMGDQIFFLFVLEKKRYVFFTPFAVLWKKIYFH